MLSWPPAGRLGAALRRCTQGQPHSPLRLHAQAWGKKKNRRALFLPRRSTPR